MAQRGSQRALRYHSDRGSPRMGEQGRGASIWKEWHIRRARRSDSLNPIRGRRRVCVGEGTAPMRQAWMDPDADLASRPRFLLHLAFTHAFTAPAQRRSSNSTDFFTEAEKSGVELCHRRPDLGIQMTLRDIATLSSTQVPTLRILTHADSYSTQVCCVSRCFTVWLHTHPLLVP